MTISLRLAVALLLSLLLAGTAALYAETCAYTGESYSGSNKICSYACPSGHLTVTVKAGDVCPASISR